MVGKRMKEIRNAIGMTQNEFAEEIGLKRNTIATYEMGRGDPSDRTIRDICKRFGVSELWFREGIGDMFRKLSTEEELYEFFGEVNAGSPGFRKAFISVLSRMTPEEWSMLERKAWELVAAMKEIEKADP